MSHPYLDMNGSLDKKKTEAMAWISNYNLYIILDVIIYPWI